MGSSSFLVLMVSLALVTLVAAEGVKGGEQACIEKAGVCPADNIRCFKSDPPQCHTDQDCLGERKCCYLHCGFKCVIPVKKLEEGGNKDEYVSGPCPEPGWEAKSPGSSSTGCPQK
ncbi:WAP four-disulfide core domain protein 12 [Macaca nemestrina]|uniref:WAP four-disulfide core domain protein 12 n=1 Tax=Macaca nemestrina TaxID=9545 RepID=UPI0039B9AF70